MYGLQVAKSTKVFFSVSLIFQPEKLGQDLASHYLFLHWFVYLINEIILVGPVLQENLFPVRAIMASPL